MSTATTVTVPRCTKSYEGLHMDNGHQFDHLVTAKHGIKAGAAAEGNAYKSLHS